MDPRSKTVTVQDVVDLLNEAAALDPQAMRALVDQRVICNAKLAAHPAIQVGNGWGCITAIIDGDAPIQFEALDNSGKG